jgi:hypothetical protein
MSKQHLNCAHCERAFRAKRSTARFCSDTCRKAQNRAHNTSIISVTKHAPLSPPVLSVTRALAASVGASSGILDTPVGVHKLHPVAWVYFMDEAPAIGCGHRRVWITFKSDKWVHVRVAAPSATDEMRAKLPRDLWDRIEQASAARGMRANPRPVMAREAA